jgi:hypothetical protein
MMVTVVVSEMTTSSYLLKLIKEKSEFNAYYDLNS